jgi:cytochrome c-type biogenesis protein CcmH
MIRRSLCLALLVVLVGGALAPAALAACGQPRASLTDVENDVMCTLCHESLAVAQSPQADAERNYIRGLIAQCETKQQIEQNMVAQYGEAVLGKPPASGVSLTIYILPPAVLLIGVAILAVTLPRWRRRTRAAHQPAPATAPAVDAAENARLEQELSQFRG